MTGPRDRDRFDLLYARPHTEPPPAERSNVVLRWEYAVRRDHAGTIRIDRRGAWWLLMHAEGDHGLWALMLPDESAQDCDRRVSQAVHEALKMERPT